MVQIIYENFEVFKFKNPFLDAKKHFAVAFAKNSQIEDLIHKKIILPIELEDTLRIPLRERVKHLTLGLLETVGLLLIVVPFIVSIAERRFWGIQTSQPYRSPHSKAPDNSNKIFAGKDANISKELLNKACGTYSNWGHRNEIIKKILSHVCDNTPANPFELYIQNVATYFQFNMSSDVPVYQFLIDFNDSRVGKNLRDNHLPNPTDHEKCAYSMWGYRLNDKVLLKNYHKRNTNLNPLRFVAINMLISYYLQKRNDVVFLDSSGNNYLQNNDPTNKIACCGDLFLLNSEEDVKEYVQTILYNELESHPTNRPKTIFLPLSFFKAGKDGHVCLLIIEPSSSLRTQAKISMVNTNGDHITTYKSYEIAAMKAAEAVYNHPETSSIRNEIRLWATRSCSHNILDILIQLADVPNVYNAVKEGLEPMTEEKDKLAWVEHGEKIRDFLKENYEHLFGRPDGA